MKELEWEVIKLCLLPIIGMGIKEISDEFMSTREWEYKYKFLFALVWSQFSKKITIIYTTIRKQMGTSIINQSNKKKLLSKENVWGFITKINKKKLRN
jgi:hypothetical protein